MNKRVKNLFFEIQSSIRTPTPKQKETYGRFLHTLSAACFIGSVTLIYSEPHTKANAAVNVVALFLCCDTISHWRNFQQRRMTWKLYFLASLLALLPLLAFGLHQGTRNQPKSMMIISISLSDQTLFESQS